MPEKYSSSIYFLFALAAISGGLGGCAVASQRLVSGRSMRPAFFFAYAIVGVVCGLVYASFGLANVERHPIEVIGPSILFGIMGALAIGSMNLCARIMLKHLGIEVQITMRKTDEDRRSGTDDAAI